MNDRTPLAELTSDALDHLYDRLARAEAAIETVAEVLADHNGDEWSSHPATIAVGAAITMKPVSGPAATQATEPACTCTGTDAGLNACETRPTPWPDIPGATRIRPREHCGHLAPTTLFTTRLTECVLRPSHDGSHADDRGCRWWPIPEAAPIATAHRYCILCGGQSPPAHTCDPAGLRTVYRGLADRADELETNNAALVRCAERAGVRRDQLAAILREALAAFRPVSDDGTRTLVGYVSAPVHPTDYERWHAALEPAKEQH